MYEVKVVVQAKHYECGQGGEWHKEVAIAELTPHLRNTLSACTFSTTHNSHRYSTWTFVLFSIILTLNIS